MRLADAHLHLFRHGFAERYGAAWGRRHEVEVYETLRQAHDIERGLVIGYEGQPKFRGNNRDLVRWAEKHPWITPLAFVPATQPPTPRRLEALWQQGFAGIALYLMNPEAAEDLNHWPLAVYEWLDEHRTIISLNAPPAALGLLQPFLAKLTACSVLISHLGLPGRFATPPPRSEARRILQPLRSLAALPHVGVKISGLYAVSNPAHDYPHESARPFIQQLYDDFGSKRLYWGSDFSPALEHVSFAQTIGALSQLGWSSADLQRIGHDNLMRIIRRVRPA